MEFQESDIIFSDEFVYSSDQSSPSESNLTSFRRQIKVMREQKEKQRECSVPLSIPGSSSSSPSSSFRYDSADGLEYYDDNDFLDDENEIVPPHVILDRRSGHLYKNNGKGKKKNLIHFRNSILKLTGFLES